MSADPTVFLWRARSWLSDIQDTAHARLFAPAALLGAVLARAAALTPYHYVLPAVVGAQQPLNLYVVLGGPPGTGKTVAVRVARELLPFDLDADGENPASGEGIIEGMLAAPQPEAKTEQTTEPTLYDWKDQTPKKKHRPVVAHQHLLVTDEAAELTGRAGRQGNTLLATLRTAWSGGALSTRTAEATRNRYVPPLSYRLCHVLAGQPDTLRTIVVDDQTGTADRYLVFWSQDPHIVDDPTLSGLERLDWKPARNYPPGSKRINIDVADEVRAEVRAQRMEAHRTPQPEGGRHGTLQRLRVAAIVHTFDYPGQAPAVTVEGWELAASIQSLSVLGRRQIIEHLTEQSQRRLAAARQVRDEDRQYQASRTDQAISTAIVAYGRCAAKAPGPVTSGWLWRRLSSRLRRTIREEGGLTPRDLAALAADEGTLQAHPKGGWVAADLNGNQP